MCSGHRLETGRIIASRRAHPIRDGLSAVSIAGKLNYMVLLRARDGGTVNMNLYWRSPVGHSQRP